MNKPEVILATAISSLIMSCALAADTNGVPKGGLISKKSGPVTSTGPGKPLVSTTSVKTGSWALYGWGERQRRAGYEKEQDSLRTMLLKAKRTQYKSVLDDLGYVATVISADSPTELELEAVKAD